MMRPEAKAMDRPIHGGKGWMSPAIMDFSANLNPLGPPLSIAEVMVRSSRDIGHYPDDLSSGFRGAVASSHGFSESNVLPSAGSSEVIRLFPEVFLGGGDKVLMPWPTFAEYGRACQLMGAEVERVRSVAASGYGIGPTEIMSLLDRGFRAVYVCNPNNPTASVMRRQELLELVEECERLGVLAFLDETLLELMSDYDSLSLAPEVESHDNLLIARSMTKSFAIPGMRLGYGLGSKRMIACMERCRQTWNLGAIEQVVGKHLIEECGDHVRRGAKVLSDEKSRFVHLLGKNARLGATQPKAFFFFLDLRPLCLTGAELNERLSAHGVLVRDCASFGPPFGQFVRFCPKSAGEDDALLDALQKSFEGMEALP